MNRDFDRYTFVATLSDGHRVTFSGRVIPGPLTVTVEMESDATVSSGAEGAGQRALGVLSQAFREVPVEAWTLRLTSVEERRR